jgi:RHS repeat-associated protein
VTGQNLRTGTTTMHRTRFDHAIVGSFQGEGALEPTPVWAMVGRTIEPGAEWPLEERAHYEYDRFGNLITTTSCASDFNHCGLGQTNPAANPTNPDPEHPPFRTTRTSYDPAHYQVSGGRVTSLPYGPGRFPVRTTNAAGHLQYFAYDEDKGVLLQQTDANGVHSCSLYDNFGRVTTTIARCGVEGRELVTTVDRYLSGPGPARARVVAVTRPPVGTPAWVYTDALGQTVGQVTRGFDGHLVTTLTEHDLLGRVVRVSKPFVAGQQPLWTTTKYDRIGRLEWTTDELGAIDQTGSPRVARVDMTYAGSTLHVDRTVAGVTQRRSETKNALGKSAKVVDADGVALYYEYDGDGNVTKVGDPVTGLVPETSVHYDRRGRKERTVDPDVGEWRYRHDGFGDLVNQSSADNQTTRLAYDTLGRVIRKMDASGTAQWVYDAGPGGVGMLAAMVSAPDSRLLAPCDGIQHITVTGGNRAGRSFRYSPFGELVEATECINGEVFRTDNGYDHFGRHERVTYPEIAGERLTLESHYTVMGHLHYVTDAADDGVYWKVLEMNPSGQITREQTRNGVETVSRHTPSGLLFARTAVSPADSNRTIQQVAYSYDEAGNLLGRSRADVASGDLLHLEDFTYDRLNRLRTARLAIPGRPVLAEGFDYDHLGNMTMKTGRTYSYNTGCSAGPRPAGPHALCAIDDGPQFQYDANGNMTAGKHHLVTYNAQNKPIHIVSDPVVSDGHDRGEVWFMYGADGNRVVQENVALAPGGGSTLARTVYVGLGGTGKGLYERTTRGATTEHVQFLYAGSAHGGSAFAVRVLTTEQGSAPAAGLKYYQYDHIGSVVAMTDENGRVRDAIWGEDATVMSYDVWGARRTPFGQLANQAGFKQQPGKREFTSHESIPSVALINMNGRIYDPAIGRFLSPDPYVQREGDLQSYNRYSYALNNPLRFTDPTGYFLDGGLDFMVNFMLTVSSIVVCSQTAGAGCALAFGIAAAIYNTTSMIAAGAGPGDVMAAFVVGIVAGQLGSGITSGISSVFVRELVSGAIASGVSSMLLTPTFGDNLGRDILRGAFEGALVGAISAGQPSLAPVSAATADGAPPGGATGAAVVLRREVQAAIQGAELSTKTRAMHHFLEWERFQLADPTAGWGEPDGPTHFASLLTTADVPGCFSSVCPIPDHPPDYRPEFKPYRPAVPVRNTLVFGLGLQAAGQLIYWGGSASAMIVVDTSGGAGLAFTLGARGGIGFGATLGPAAMVQVAPGGIMGLEGWSASLGADWGGGSFAVGGGLDGGGISSSVPFSRRLSLPAWGANFFVGAEVSRTAVIRFR